MNLRYAFKASGLIRRGCLTPRMLGLRICDLEAMLAIAMKRQAEADNQFPALPLAKPSGGRGNDL